MSANPLAGHFRIPGVHQELPSRGNYYKPGDIKLAINGEIAVLPMTAADEIILKNPDGLLNGDSIERLLSSCVPDIKNPRQIPNPDVDVLLLSIKLCSTGDELEVQAKCPKCNSDNHFALSIRSLLAKVTPLIERNEVRLSDDLVAYLKPYTFESNTKLNMGAFEETRLFQSMFNPEISELDRQTQFNESFAKIAHLNLELLSECIMKIATVDAEGVPVEVTEQEFIREFVMNTDKGTVAKIQEAMKLFGEGGLPKTMDAFCSNEECLHEWETDFNFDPSHFFD
jgi:hypothetical protein